MEKEYIGLMGVVIGGIVAYGISFLQMRNDERKDKRKMCLQKLEESHKTITMIREIYLHNFTSHIMIINHGIEAASEESKKALPIDNLKMLINFYIPRLRHNFEEFEKYRKEYGQILMLCMDAERLDSSAKSELKKRVSDGDGIIGQYCTDMQKQISKEANEYLKT